MLPEFRRFIDECRDKGLDVDDMEAATEALIDECSDDTRKIDLIDALAVPLRQRGLSIMEKFDAILRASGAWLNRQEGKKT